MIEAMQYHLAGVGMSGRGERVRQLEPDVHREVENQAAHIAGPDATGMSLTNIIQQEALKRMVFEVTEKAGLENLDGAKWRRIQLSELALPDQWRAFFTTKDTSFLEDIHRRYHRVTQAEVDMIVGKAIPVSLEG